MEYGLERVVGVRLKPGGYLEDALLCLFELVGLDSESYITSTRELVHHLNPEIGQVQGAI